MTKTEIAARIKDLDKYIFLLAMKDHWDAADWKNDAAMKNEMRELKKKMQELG